MQKMSHANHSTSMLCYMWCCIYNYIVQRKKYNKKTKYKEINYTYIQYVPSFSDKP